MGKKQIIITVVATFLAAGAASEARAMSFPNPNPAIYGDDIGGTGYFVPTGDPFLTVRFFEFSPGGTFGMYYKNHHTNLIPLFDGSDVPFNIAAIDLASGNVYDWDILNATGDLGASLQSTFSPSAEPIGFYYTPLIAGLQTLYADPFLNGGLDAAAIYPVLGSNPAAYLYSFIYTDPYSGQTQTLSWHAATGVSPNVVPVPSALLLFGSGLFGVFGFGSRKPKK